MSRCFSCSGKLSTNFLKKAKNSSNNSIIKKVYTSATSKFFPVCNLKHRTINSYPKCRAISSTAPFRNLNCPRSLFCPNSAFFAANSPWTPRINLKVNKKTKFSSIYPFILLCSWNVEILTLNILNVASLGCLNLKISRATVDSILKVG